MVVTSFSARNPIKLFVFDTFTGASPVAVESYISVSAKAMRIEAKLASANVGSSLLW